MDDRLAGCLRQMAQTRNAQSSEAAMRHRRHIRPPVERPLPQFCKFQKPFTLENSKSTKFKQKSKKRCCFTPARFAAIPKKHHAALLSTNNGFSTSPMLKKEDTVPGDVGGTFGRKAAWAREPMGQREAKWQGSIAEAGEKKA